MTSSWPRSIPRALPGHSFCIRLISAARGDDIGYGIAVDSSPNAYVTGSTTSTDFNAGDVGTTALQPGNGGGTDAFVAKLGVLCTGTSCTTPLPLNYFTYLGGAGTDVGTAIGVDNNSAARITGWTNSPNFPIVGNCPAVDLWRRQQRRVLCQRRHPCHLQSDHNSDLRPNQYLELLRRNGRGSRYRPSAGYAGLQLPVGRNSFHQRFPFEEFCARRSERTERCICCQACACPELDHADSPTATPLVVGVGSQVSFAYTITNSGEFTNGVTFVDNLPATGATFVSATASPGTCGGAVNLTVLCNIGTLNAAATATVTVVLTPAAPTIPGGTVSLGNSGSAFVGQSTVSHVERQCHGK